MSTLLTILIVILFIATIGSLLAGVVSMGAGGDFDQRNSTRLMSTRVGLQAFAVGLIVLMMFLIGR